jgi:N4-gp56 family major capsid protein
MALGTNHVTTTTGATFIPELWSDEVIAAYKQNLVVANHVTKINHQGKKGDVIHIPKPTRGSASSKAAETQVTLIADTESEVTVTINKHYEYSRLIEDITDKQALSSLRRFYTDDAGYALAKQIDQDVFIQAHTMQGGTQFSGSVIGSDGSTAWDGTASTNTGNAAALTDAGIRKMAQTLDDADVPMDGRVIIIPPVEKNNLLGLSRFTEQAFTGEIGGGNSIRNGLVGDIYGMMVYVSTNCPWVHLDSADGDDYFGFSSAAIGTGSLTDATGTAVTVGTDGGVAGRVGLMLHRDAMTLATQMSVRSQTQYKQEYLGDLFTADTIYGTGELRDDACVPFIVAD